MGRGLRSRKIGKRLRYKPPQGICTSPGCGGTLFFKYEKVGFKSAVKRVKKCAKCGYYF